MNAIDISLGDIVRTEGNLRVTSRFGRVVAIGEFPGFTSATIETPVGQLLTMGADRMRVVRTKEENVRLRDGGY